MLSSFSSVYWPSVCLWGNVCLGLTTFQFSVFFFLSCMSYLYSLEINPLWIALFANIFSHSVCSLLLLFLVSSTMQKLVSLIRSHLFILVFIFITLNCWVAQSSYCLWSHGLQHARLPCPTLSPRVCSCLLSWWCHPTISFSVALFFSCLQSFPAWGPFPVNCLFTSGGQGSGASASASVLPMNSQSWFPLGLTGWISLLSKGLLRVFSSTTIWKHQFFGAQASL